MRHAEHLWPALLKAEFTTSSTMCSVRAELSAIRQLRPPVSAMKFIRSSLSWSCFWITFAVSKDPVKTTFCKFILEKINGHISYPLPNINAAAFFGRPAFNKSLKIT